MKWAIVILSKIMEVLGYEVNPMGTSVLSSLGSLHKSQVLRLGGHFKNAPHDELDQISSFSKSQLGQDLLALGIFGPDRKGFFVEFGATDGIELSNTWLLEKNYGWSGILAEPGRAWESSLRANRQSFIDTDCVFSESGIEVLFSEVNESRALSTIAEFKGSDFHGSARLKSNDYRVRTVSLSDLLDRYRAPKDIDFLSIDTEGSEFEILSHHNFSNYSFKLICVEHNYTINRDKIKSLLLSLGYRHIYPEFSSFDDWYLRSDVASQY